MPPVIRPGPSSADVTPTRRSLHLFALAALAVAQPLLDVVGRSPEFLVAHDLDGLDIVAIVVALVLGVPGLLVGMAWLAGRVRPAARVAVERLSLIVLLAALVLLVGKQLLGVTAASEVGAEGASVGASMLVVAVAVGVLLALGYERLPAARTFASVLGIGLVVVPGLFLARPSVRRLVVPPEPLARAEVTPDVTPPIVMVVFDQLPLTSLLGSDGLIDASRYPAFAALADDAVWFRQATTVGNYTGWALPAILDGRYPDTPALPVAADHPRSLFTLLGGSYALDVREPITSVCPTDLCPPVVEPRSVRVPSALADLGVVYLHVVLPESLTRELPSVTENWRDFASPDDWQARWVERRDRDRRRVPEAFIASLGRRDQPTLHFLHVLLPHEPYVFLPSGQPGVTSTYLPGLVAERWTDDEFTVAQNYQLHLLQVGYVDGLLGRIVDRLESEGLYDEALLIVTSDHGVSFRPGGPFKGWSDGENAVDLMAVPLFVKLPGGAAGRIDDRPVESVDVLPTIADVLGVTMPWPVDGRSALGSAGADRSQKRLYGQTGRYMVVDHPLDLRRAARRKARLLGGGDVFSSPVMTPYTQLVGTPAAQYPRARRSDVRSTLASPDLFSEVDPVSGIVPARITGRLNMYGDDGPFALAVGINGVIRATTRVAGESFEQARGFWSALVDPESFRRGHNVVEVFVVTDGTDGPALTPVYSNGRASSGGDLGLVGAELLHGVELSGFHAQEWIGSMLVRCTDGHGTLVVPRPSTRPEGLAISIARASAGFTRFELRIDGCLLVDERLPPGRWSRTIPLESCAPDRDPTTIELISDAFTPRGQERSIGVCLDGLHFVP